MFFKKRLCHRGECGRIIWGKPISSVPARHMCSPSGAGFKNYFCSDNCREINATEAYIFFAELDQNASDSQCFQHIKWIKDFEDKRRIAPVGRKLRYGRCKITKQEFAVEPLCPGDNSGQPQECYDHFILLDIYGEKLRKLYAARI